MSLSPIEACARQPLGDTTTNLNTATFTPDSIVPDSSTSWDDFVKNHELTGSVEDEVFALSIVTSCLYSLAQDRRGNPSAAFTYDRLMSQGDELAMRYLALHPRICHSAIAVQPDEEAFNFDNIYCK